MTTSTHQPQATGVCQHCYRIFRAAPPHICPICSGPIVAVKTDKQARAALVPAPRQSLDGSPHLWTSDLEQPLGYFDNE